LSTLIAGNIPEKKIPNKNGKNKYNANPTRSSIVFIITKSNDFESIELAKPGKRMLMAFMKKAQGIRIPSNDVIRGSMPF
jgi:hypothetical protein